MPADAAAGRCQAKPATPAKLRPGEVLPDWALSFCKDWHRLDGSCDQMQIIADYQECLSKEGIPEQQRMLDLHVGSRAVLRARDRATFLCLELRHWVMSEPARQEWIGNPRPATPPPS